MDEEYYNWIHGYTWTETDAKVSNLIEELNRIRYTRVVDVDDVNNKIDNLIEILLRGVDFKDGY